MVLRGIAERSVAVLLGSVGGGLVGAIISAVFAWFILQESMARTLLSEGLAIHALEEAWIVEGPGYQNVIISNYPKHKLSPVPKEKTLWLKKVEVRAILDQEEWNVPEAQSYGFIGNRRAWIIRDQIVKKRSYPKALTGEYEDPHPAIISSKGIHELAGWIERVTSAYASWLLSTNGLEALRIVLEPVSGQDRIDAFQNRLSPRAKKFLSWYRQNYVDKRK